MARLVNSQTGVVVVVADEKADRFDANWTAEEPKKAPAKRAPKTEK